MMEWKDEKPKFIEKLYTLKKMMVIHIIDEEQSNDRKIVILLPFLCSDDTVCLSNVFNPYLGIRLAQIISEKKAPEQHELIWMSSWSQILKLRI